MADDKESKKTTSDSDEELENPENSEAEETEERDSDAPDSDDTATSGATDDPDEDEDDDEVAAAAEKRAAEKKAAEKKAAAKASERKAEKKSGSGKGGGPPRRGGGDPPEVAEFGDNIRLGAAAQKAFTLFGGIGVASLGISLVLGMMGDSKRALFSYLTAYAWILSIGIGALWWVTLQHLVNAKWSIALRRVGELLAQNMLLLAVLALPIIVPTALGNDALYVWVNHEKVHADHLLHHKAPYLNVGFFLVRCAIYFGFWVLLSRYFLNKSLEQDKSAKPAEISAKLAKVSAPSMILIALTLTFAAIDFLMTLEPSWFSTMFGVYYFAGCSVSFHSLLALTLMWIQRQGALERSITTEHYHDVGKMMFAFTAFWAYIGFSQFMLIWYANIPEETFWYKHRFAGEWETMSWGLVFGNFVIPFFGLMSRSIKRNRKTLAFWAVWILVVHYMDMYWLVIPAMGTEHIPFSILDLTCLIGVFGVFAAGAAYQARKVILVPIRDPRLPRSLAFENF